MIFINEWLPNPVGSDTSGEWIELWNSGNEEVNLSGWKIVSGGSTSLTTGSKFSLSGKSIGAQNYLLLPRSGTKLVLKNIDGKVSLYNAAGQLVDSASFLGSAPEGKSFARVGYESETGQGFIWSEPTPGAPNKISLDSGIIRNTYPTGIPLNHPLSGVEFLALLLGTAVVLTSLTMFVLKRNEDLSKLFFGRNEEIR